MTIEPSSSLNIEDLKEYFNFPENINCPRCKSVEIKKTIYGLLDEPFSEEVKSGIKENLISLGGCIIHENEEGEILKEFYCKKCNYFWPESEQVNIQNITKDYQCN